MNRFEEILNQAAAMRNTHDALQAEHTSAMVAALHERKAALDTALARKAPTGSVRQQMRDSAQQMHLTHPDFCNPNEVFSASSRRCTKVGGKRFWKDVNEFLDFPIEETYADLLPKRRRTGARKAESEKKTRNMIPELANLLALYGAMMQGQK